MSADPAIARAIETGRLAAEELRAPTARLLSALERGRARNAPEVKVRTADLKALFTLITLASKSAVGVDAVRRLPWHKRLLAALRESRPA